MAKLGNASEAPGGGSGIGRGIARPSLSKPAAARLGIDKRFPKTSFAKSAVPSKAYTERNNAGITGEGGKNVTPIYKQSIPPASVKVVSPKSTSANAVTNNSSTIKTNNAASGASAKNGAAHAEKFYATQPKAKPVKINSNK